MALARFNPDDPTLHENHVVRLQRNIRTGILYPMRLRRDHLIERMFFERGIVKNFGVLMNQILVFSLFVIGQF